MKSLTIVISLLFLFSCQHENEVTEKNKSEISGKEYDRSILPIARPIGQTFSELDARDANRPDPWSLKAPEGAPNIVLVMLDDFGFGQSSAFGGPINMSAADNLAEEGLVYNRFHTTAICSPTRAALLTGRNHHSASMAVIPELSTSFPSYTGIISERTASIAEILRLNGYNTAHYGKSHETAAWETSVTGPFDRWPTRRGFEEFYGFIGGETNQFRPSLYHGTTKVELDEEDPEYHLTEDMADRAVQYMKAQKSLTPDKPFFLYFAPGAVHAPFHVPDSYINKYKGKFDEGWDVMREKTLARQIELGIVPKGTKLAEKPDFIKDWNKLSEKEQKIFARQMEVFAAFAEHTDDQVGRLQTAIKEMGIEENTIFIYILGDNGASAEGLANGLLNETTFFNGIYETIDFMYENLNKYGTEESFSHYASGWAVAGNTPFKWAKQVAGNFGGVRNGLIISWPGHMKETKAIRDQFCHVIDIAPTILEAAGLPEPTKVNGVEQKPIEGFSMLKTFTNSKEPEFHKTQYFEIGGNRGIYHDGWMASVLHREPWKTAPNQTFKEDEWELFKVDEDFSQSTDLSKKHPEKLSEMKALFHEEAMKFGVYPLDDRSIERFDPAQAGRPDLMGGRTSLTVYEGMFRMLDNTFINVKNTSCRFTTEIEIEENANGVILAHGGRFGGYSLYMINGKPVYTYNWASLEKYDVASSKKLSAGKHTLVYDFKYDGGGFGKGGTLTIFANDEKIAEGRIDKTISNMFSLDEGADVGFDEGTNVTDNYDEYNNAFSGKVNFVRIDIK